MVNEHQDMSGCSLTILLLKCVNMFAISIIMPTFAVL